MSRLIAQRYEVIETLHEGGLKAVHRVLDRRAPLHGLVLKELIDDRVESRGLIRFHNEYRLTRDLAHPSIPDVVGFGWEDDPEHPFIVEEFAPGIPASAVPAAPAPELLVEVLAQACGVLGYLNARRLVHFDIKPDNLVLELEPGASAESGGGRLRRLRLVDFDLAGPQGPGGAGRGTLPYMAPEVRTGEESIDGRADLFSLGASIVAMIVGGHPDDLPLDPDPRVLFEFLPEGTVARYGRPFLSLVHALIQAHPDERPPTARETLAQLAEFAGGVGIDSVDDRLATIARPRFVGRLEEMARLRELLPGARSLAGASEVRPRRFVLVTGERGVGKTRFIDQHLVALETSRRVVLRLHSDPGRSGGDATSLAALERDLILAEDDPDDTEANSLRGYAELSDPRRFLYYSALTSRMLRFASRQAPLCLVVDDLHTLDRLEREFVAYALRRVHAEAQGKPAELPVQVVLAAVRSRLVDLELNRLVTELIEDRTLDTIALDPLERGLSAELVEAMTSPERPLPAAVDRLHERTHGNPLFIRETVAALLVDEDHVLGVEEAFRPERLEAAPVATKVRGVVQSRVARVAGSDLEVLQMVALHPWPATLSHFVSGGGLQIVEVREIFERLEQRGLIAMTRLDLPTFVDKDSREVVVGMMSEARRRDLHARWARMLIDHETADEAWTRTYHRLRAGEHGEALWEESLAIGRDLTGGGRDGEAAHLFEAVLERGDQVPPFLRQRAALEWAELRRRRFEPEQALELLERHLSSAVRRTVESTLIEARALGMQGHFRDARRRLEDAVESALADRHWAGAARLALHRAETFLGQGKLTETELALNEAAGLLERLEATPEVTLPRDEELAEIVSPSLPTPCPHGALQAALIRLRADFEFKRGRQAPALALALLSVKMEAREGNLPGLGQGLHLVGTIYMQGGLNEAAESHFRRALDLHRNVLNLKAQADTLNNLGILMRRQGKSREAIELLEEALELRREIGHRQGEVDCWLNIATIHTQRRELSAAASAFQTCLKLKQKLPENNNPGVILNNLGVVAQLRDRLSAALRYYRDAASTERGFGNEATALVWEVNEGLALAAAGRWVDARVRFESIEPGLREGDLRVYLGYLRWGQAEIAAGTSDWTEAEGALGDALEIFTNEEDEASRLESLVRLFELHLLRGRTERARWVLGALQDADLDQLAPEVRQRYECLELRLMAEGEPAADEPPECLERVMAALRTAQQTKMPGQAFIAASALAYFHDRADRRERAFYFYNLALEHLENALGAINDQQLMDSWLDTPMVREFRRRSRVFTRKCMPSREDDNRRLSYGVRNALRDMKHVFFDVERELETTVVNMRRNEEGVRRILEIGHALSEPVSMEILLERIVDGVVDFAGAERAFLIFVEEGEPRIAAARTTQGEPVGDAREQVSMKAVNRIIETRRPLLLQNAMEEDEFRIRQSVVQLGLRSIMAVPMLRQEELVGIIYVENRSRIGQFQPADLELLSILATQSAIAVENARLVHDFIREERMRMLGIMAGGVAHDFNNLLAAILGRVQLMRNRGERPEQKSDLEIIEKAARDGAVVARRLQDFTAVSRSADMVAVPLRDLVQDVLEFTRPHWEGEEFRRDLPLVLDNRVDAGLSVRGQPAELREVLMNVLLNGLTSLAGGGTIIFEARGEETVVHLAIRLRGPGAEANVDSDLVDPMHSNRDRPGGLGMSVAYGILLRHGGRVRIETEEELGYSVLIELPSAERNASASAAGFPRRRDVESTGSRILVVDDEEGVRELLEEILVEEGYEVVNASSGPAALEAFDDHPFDLVITDLGMVPMSGWDLAREIKQRDPDVAVILLTGHADAGQVAGESSPAVDQIMSKPFEVAELLSVVEARLG